MKELGKKCIAKITILAIVFTMLFSNFLPIISLAAEGTESSEEEYGDKIVFNVTVGEESVAGEKTVIPFNLALSGVVSGFSNLKIKVEDKTTPKAIYDVLEPNKDNTLVEKSKSNSGMLVFKSPIDSGVEVTGAIQATFREDSNFQTYNKEFDVIVTGDYNDPATGERQYVYIKRTVSTSVVTKDKFDAFSSKIKMGNDSGSSDLISVKRCTESGMQLGEWYSNELTFVAPVKLIAHNVAYGKYMVKLSRTSNVLSAADLNSEENLQVTIENLPEYIEYSLLRNADGTVDIVLEIGEEKESYTKDELKDILVDMKVSAKFKIPEDTKRNGTTSSTDVTAIFSGDVVGYDVTIGKDGVSLDKRNDKYENRYAKNIGLNYFVGDYLANMGIDTDSTPRSTWQSKVDTGLVDITYTTAGLYWDRRQMSEKQQLKVYSYKDGKYANIKYADSDGDIKTLNLTGNEMVLKSIKYSAFDGSYQYVKFYKKDETEPFFTATPTNKIYNVPEGEIITDYYAVFDYMMGTNFNSYPSWDSTYTLNIAELNGTLSEDEIKSAKGITRYQNAVFGSTVVNTSSEATHSIYIPSSEIKKSYFYMNMSNMDTNVSSYGKYEDASINLVMEKDETIKDNPNNIFNKNPKFFVKLPDYFDYKGITVSVNSSCNLIISNSECTDKSEKSWYVTNDGYLVINCVGEWSYTSGAASIKISFKRRLNTYAVNETDWVYSYMITDNGDYINRSKLNFDGLSKNGHTPNSIAYSVAQYSISTDSVVKIRNGIVVANNEYYPSAESYNKTGTAENPVKVKAGDTVTYKTEIEANGNNISNLNVICRLPVKNNKSIHGEVYDLGSTNDLINLSNIKVMYRNGTRESSIGSNNYKIKYSTDINAGFDSEFVEYVDGDSNFSNAKTIQILFNEDYAIQSNNAAVIIYFDMEMSAMEGMAGQISAVKYMPQNGTEYSSLEPAAVYAVKGNPNGTVVVQKIYEGYSVGNAPAGLSLQGINFKIKNIDTDNILVLEGQTDSNGIIQTDSQGRFTLTDVPVGRYEVIEVSEINEYILEYTSFEIINGEQVSVHARNTLLRHKLILKKKWQFDDAAQQASVRLTVRASYGSYSSTVIEVNTDINTGEAEIYIPYGRFLVSEAACPNGWKMKSQVYQSFSQENQVYEVENYIPTTTLRVVKSVPNNAGAADTIEGIKLKVEGSAYAGKYVDVNGEEHELKMERTLIVGEGTEGVTQSWSSDRKTVTFIMNDMYVGNYTITEFEMPKIDVDGQMENKYVDLVQDVSLSYTSENVVNIQNTWKRGRVKIQKTAEEGVDLSQFKFRIYGTSYYGTDVDEIVCVDEYGKAQANVYIGNYTIEEVGADAFNASYEVTSKGVTTNSNDRISIKVDGKSVVNVNVDNETAYGYVKVVKTLEDNSDVSKVQGIKFYVSGTAPSGRNIKEEIVIGSDGTGTSAAIPAGGEYILYEDESTVPDNYEPMDEMEIHITKLHTQENPLELRIENKRGKGNLGIETQTYPEGGDVYPITYKLQEIQFTGVNNEYSRIDGTAKSVDADLSGKAYLVDIPAGVYIVEQESVPKGYTRDIPQIVDVPMYGTANVVFVIEKQDGLEDTMVRITKKVLNPERNVATEEDFSKYGLNKKESFEVKLTNVNSYEEFFAFVSPTREAIIQGLPSGRYSVEEIYKPKYNVDSYYLVEEGIKSKITAENGKYYIDVDCDSEVSVHIDNIIDDTFGFGAQGSRENLSKTDVEAIENGTYTRSNIVVVDEKGEFIDGCTFELYDANGRNILEFSPRTIQTIIRGLDVGVYTIKNTVVPTGYLKADDSEIIVYEDAVRIKRIEIQKNIPRGNLTLKTTYLNGNTQKYVPKSKYQIVDSDTGNLLKFTKNSDGSYKRSNLADAVDTISLRAGEVTVYGMETGNYEVGIVDIANGFGITDDDVKVAMIAEDETNVVCVEAERTQIVKIESTRYATFILDSFGNLWAWGSSGSYGLNIYGTGNTYEPQIIETGVKYFDIGEYSGAVIYYDGSVATWGQNYDGALGIENVSIVDTPTMISVENKKFVDVSVGSYSSMLLLDEDGKVWYSGNNSYCGLGSGKISGNIVKPICLTDFEDSPFKGIQVSKIFSGYYLNAVIDSEGRLWTWGNTGNIAYTPSGSENYTAMCVSLKEGNDINTAYKNGNKIVEISNGFAIDDAGNAYFFGTNYSFPSNATCITKPGGMFEGKKFKKAVATNESNCPCKFALIDTDNKLYCTTTCVNDMANSKYKDVEFKDIALGGYSATFVDKNNNLYSRRNDYVDYGQGGAGRYTKSVDFLMEYQIPIPNYSAYFKYDIKFKKVCTNSNAAYAIDYDGNLWSWGSSSDYNYLGNAIRSNNKPRMIEFNEDIKFKDVCTDDYNITLAIDTKGRLWVWGYDSSSKMFSGINPSDTGFGYGYFAKTCVSEMSGNPLNTAYQSGIYLEEISIVNNVVIAKDNRNKIWVWGTNAPRFNGGQSPMFAVCISDREPLKSLYDEGKYIKSLTNASDSLSLDNEGMIWAVDYGAMSKITDYKDSSTALLAKEMYQTGLKIVDVKYTYALDEYGRIWKVDNRASNNLYVAGELEGEYTNGCKMMRLINTAEQRVIGIDDRGRVWNIEEGKIVMDTAKFIDASKFGEVWIAIDEDDHIHVLGSGYDYRLGLESYSESGKIVSTTAKDENKLKGIKFIDLGVYLESNDGYLYDIGYTGFTKKNPTSTFLKNMGIEIKQELYYNYTKYVVSEDGKLYSIYPYGQGEDWVCQTDEENALKSEYYDNDVKVEEIIEFGGQYYIKDSLGRIWDMNYTLLTDFEVKQFLYADSGTDFGRLKNVIVEDMNGNYWINGSNEFGELGIGDLSVTQSKQFVKINLEDDLKIKEFIWFGGRHIYVKDENDVIWAWGSNNVGQLGLPTSTGKVAEPYCWNLKAQQVAIDSTSAFVLDDEGNLWSCGLLSGKVDCTLGKVDTNGSMGKIVKLVVTAGSIYAINEDGDLWVWGNNYYGALGYPTELQRRYYDSSLNKKWYTYTGVEKPVCLTKTVGSVYYNKKIKDVIDIGGYRVYYSEVENYSSQGSSYVFVCTDDGEIYAMGRRGSSLNSSEMYVGYPDYNGTYPTPVPITLDGNITNIDYLKKCSYHSASYEVFVQTDTGAIYYGYDNQFVNITKDEYRDKTIDEVFEMFNQEKELEKESRNQRTEYELDRDNHKIIRYTKRGDVVENSYEIVYPSEVDVDKFYESSGTSTVYIIDKNGDLWVKGRYTTLGKELDEFVCITQLEYVSEAVWNNIRGRWNLIYKKF